MRRYSRQFAAISRFISSRTDAFWAKLFRQTPETFRWGFKVPEQITVPVWPVHPRYGALAGLENPTFLDAALLEQAFLRALEPYRKQTGVLIFEFGTLRQRGFENAGEFVEALDPFLAQLPAGWRYAVEIRNAEFLRARVFRLPARASTWRMSTTRGRACRRFTDQIAHTRFADIRPARGAGAAAPGRPYEEAVRQFSPYERVQEVNEPVRRGLAGTDGYRAAWMAGRRSSS